MGAGFTIYFEAPYWIGVLESEEDSALVVARHVFGSEPGNAELLHFMLYDFARLRRAASPTRTAELPVTRPRHAKRAIREARREMTRPLSTRSQAALSSALEASKAQRRSETKEEERAAERRRFELKAAKRAEKRRGH